VRETPQHFLQLLLAPADSMMMMMMIIIIITITIAISTNYFKNKILKEEIESKCRLCKQEETIDHLTSGCPILAKNKY
jgi:hypothetical protein